MAPVDWLFDVSNNLLKNPNQLLPDIIGHSLGGALTQLFATDFTSQGGRIGEVVTFNSPGIDRDQVQEFVPENVVSVNHYIVSGDLVSLAGEAFLPGQYDLLNFFDFNPLNNHLKPILTQEVYYDQQTGGQNGRLQKPNDVTTKAENAPVDWLNNSFFTYVDPEFLSLISAGLLITEIPPLQQFSFIPPLLLFRGTLEGSRQLIGGGISGIAEAISLEAIRTGTGVRVPLPNKDFNLLGLLNINATNLAVEYISKPKAMSPEEEANAEEEGDIEIPEEIFKIQGQITIPKLLNATANLAGDNFIQISNTGVDVKGSFFIKDLAIVPQVWELKELGVSIDTIENEVKGEGTVLIPTGIDIGGGIGFRNGEFNFISLEADNLNKPIANTGAFLQRISGQIDNISQSNPDPNPESEPEPISFGGDLGVTGGPQIDVSLPDWAGGGFSGSLISLDVNGDLNRERIQGNGNIQIIGGLAEGTGEAELNWNKGFLTASANFSILNDFIVTNSKFAANSNFDVMISGDATINTPEISLDLPKINVFGQDIDPGKINLQGINLAQGKFVFNYSNDGNLSNDFIQAYGKLPAIEIPIPFNDPFRIEPEATIKVTFDGNVQAWSGKPVPETNSFTVESNSQWLILHANWDNANPNVPIQIKTPNGTILNEGDFATNGIAIVDFLTTDTTKAVMIANPQRGIWDINVANPNGLGNVEYSAFRDSVAPTIQINNLAADVEGKEVTINYNAFDSDSDAKISLFYDTDNEGFDAGLFHSKIFPAP